MLAEPKIIERERTGESRKAAYDNSDIEALVEEDEIQAQALLYFRKARKTEFAELLSSVKLKICAMRISILVSVPMPMAMHERRCST